MALLQVKDLQVSFFDDLALRGVSFSIERGETLGIVGESGAGKSMAAFGIIRLISPPGKITAGSIIFDGQEITTMDDKSLGDLRGNRIAMIFQDPMMTLNPILTIGTQMVETLQAHRSLSFAEAKSQAIEKLKSVAIPSAEARFDCYPHELSGGLRQRVVIAIALLCDPELIIADEPTTALDVTIQAEIMNLLSKLCRDKGCALMLITHDLSVVAETCQRVAVMYAGRIIEQGQTQTVINSPAHPYSQGLLNALPQNNLGRDLLQQIPGNMPSIQGLPSGCAFHPRCAFATDYCVQAIPSLSSDPHQVACFTPLSSQGNS